MTANPRRMAELTENLSSKSEKMRALAKAGYKRADIARFLDVRYQFVRNVLAREEARNAADADSSRLSPAKLRLGPDGRVLIPAPFREALGLGEGDTLIAAIVDGELRLLTIAAALRRAQAIVKQFAPEGVSLADELIEDRRQEAERESRND